MRGKDAVRTYRRERSGDAMGRTGLGGLVSATVAAGVLACSAPTAHAVTAQTAIAALNAQRAANGIPAGIVENTSWSHACALHERYVAQNGTDLDDPHDEDPSKPGYTAEGRQAARSSVLGASFGADGSNGWEDAPIHLMQLLGPGLSVTGYADGCMWTWPGYQRPAPDVVQTYSYPGPGTTIYPSEVANEWPFTPGHFVDLADEAKTGPDIFLFAFGGTVSRVHLDSASVSGPDGAVEVRFVDNTTDRIGPYLPAGAVLIPVRPLRAGSAYTARAAGTGDDGTPLSWSWSFRTRTAPRRLARNPLGFRIIYNRRGWVLAVSSRAPSPKLALSHAGRRLHPRLRDGRTRPLRLHRGRWTACVHSGGGATRFRRATKCWRFSVRISWRRSGASSDSRLRSAHARAATVLRML